MAMPTEKSPYRLLVEGPGDKHAIINLLMRHNYDWDDASTRRPFVKDVGGIDKVLDSLGTNLKTYEKLGVVVDADEHLESRWQQLQDRLSKLNIVLPEKPNKTGTICYPTGFKTEQLGIWVMPDNELPGYLEHFLERLIPKPSQLWQHAKNCTREAIENHSAPLTSIHEQKGAIHAWLAWQSKPGTPFGTAITAKLFDADALEAQRFVGWFFRLFHPDFKQANP